MMLSDPRGGFGLWREASLSCRNSYRVHSAVLVGLLALATAGLPACSGAPEGEGRSLIERAPGQDVPMSQVSGVAELGSDGCLFFEGAVAVVPPGSTADDHRLLMGGEPRAEVAFGQQVTLGGALLPLSATDVIDRMVARQDRADFDRCAAASDGEVWALLVSGESP